MNRTLKSLIDEERLIRTTRDLVRIPSVNPPGNEKPVAEYVMRYLAACGVEASLISQPVPDRPQVLARIRGNGTHPPLILNGHMDVVPPGDSSKWETPPFSDDIRNGRLYGRGSSDMKGGLGVALEVARVVKSSRIPLKGDLILLFAMGEETGEPGTRTLLEHAGHKSGFGVVLEPTGLNACVAAKGLAWFQITLEGKSVHASMAEQGVNPIDKFLELGARVRAYHEKIRQRRHPLCGPATCAMTMIHAGEKENVIPETLTLTLDRRMIPGEEVETVQGEVQNLLASLTAHDPDFSPHLTRTRVYEAAEIPVNLPEVSLLCNAIERETGKKATASGAPFSTDARHFINDWGIPAVVFGPGEMDQPHTLNESIPISDLTAATRVLLDLASDLILQFSP